jgi:hypothetical protein
MTRIAHIVTVAAALGAVSVMSGCTPPERSASGPLQHESQSVELDKTELARVEIRMGAGELNVEGGSSKLLEADFTYDNPALKPVVRYTPSSFRGQLLIEQPTGINLGPNRKYEWNLRLNNMVPMDFVTRLGAGNVQLNLGSLTLRTVDLRMGVGNLDMDLRGHPQRDYDVQIQGGVGNATVRLPSNVGIVADASGGVGDIEAHGLEKRGGRWVSPAYEDAKVTIHLDIRGGVGHISLLAD